MVHKTMHSTVRTLVVLHLVFALTGILHAVGGALVPSIAIRFHLGDSDAGLLFLLYYTGTSIGALLCRWNHARMIALGFVGVVICCIAIAQAPRTVLPIALLLEGVSVGVPMSAVSLYVGRAFPERCAPMLTFLNFSWSVGALAAPLIAGRILEHHTYRAAYLLFAVMAMAAALGCAMLLNEGHENMQSAGEARGGSMLGVVFIFALAAFLEVGVENTAAAWLPTYALRTAEKGIAIAAASTSVYWFGFLVSRGLCSYILIHVASARVFRAAIATAIVAASLLAAVTSPGGSAAAMFFLGAALAPIYPLIIAGSFARVRRTSDSRWILAAAGFGGSVLPWLAGSISAGTGSLRTGMLVIPAALLLMVFVLPAFRGTSRAVVVQ
jgi:fucose permease